jgi:light-regulated signal transduction histidine kinase (bacteriophytochrome)
VRESAGEKLDAGELELLERVIANSVKLGRLIDDMLVYSRAGRTAHARIRVDIEAVAREVAAEIGAEAPAARIDVGTLPPVLGDAAALRQVLFNLIHNAVKFSAPREHPEIRVSAMDSGRDTLVCVRDNGVGFDMEFAERLFGMFQRMHTESQFAGTGVGLAIVKRIVERHGGRVWAEAAPDRGATFHFTLTRA